MGGGGVGEGDAVTVGVRVGGGTSAVCVGSGGVAVRVAEAAGMVSKGVCGKWQPVRMRILIKKMCIN
ncbi:protein of unknown function [Brevefilum fermentans]|uniref:Uncharacterized protein n=1 Tax=Candidatus Brevifilum fermentans TaxID=1986204 RepID=A0A1Y6K8D5_9CHLR|nr:protein of unknown function [Brevefilum fermentans]